MEQAAVCHGDFDREEKEIRLVLECGSYIAPALIHQAERELAEHYGLHRAYLYPRFSLALLPEVKPQDLSSLLTARYSPAAAILAGCRWELAEGEGKLHLAANGQAQLLPHLPAVAEYLRDCFGLSTQIAVISGSEKSPEELFAQTELLRRQAMKEVPAAKFSSEGDKAKKPAENNMIYGKPF